MTKEWQTSLADQPCAKCGGEVAWVPQVAANEETGGLQTQPTFRLAVNGRGTNGRVGKLQALACLGCGFVELYLADPAAFRAATGL